MISKLELAAIPPEGARAHQAAEASVAILLHIGRAAMVLALVHCRMRLASCGANAPPGMMRKLPVRQQSLWSGLNTVRLVEDGELL